MHPPLHRACTPWPTINIPKCITQALLTTVLAYSKPLTPLLRTKLTRPLPTDSSCTFTGTYHNRYQLLSDPLALAPLVSYDWVVYWNLSSCTLLLLHCPDTKLSPSSLFPFVSNLVPVHPIRNLAPCILSDLTQNNNQNHSRPATASYSIVLRNSCG